LNELIWRDFYQMILWQSDRVRKGQSFKPAFDNIEWRNNEWSLSAGAMATPVTPL
jgi:deoxyribodipyrimidine photo-lyase